MGKRASRILRASSRVNSFSSILEGLTTLTVMPFLASSRASERESATTAALAAAQVRHGGTARVQHGQKVRGKNILPVFEGRFSEGAPTEIADVVHHDIYPAKALDHGAQKLLGASGVGDVGLDGEAIGAVGLQLQKG